MKAPSKSSLLPYASSLSYALVTVKYPVSPNTLDNSSLFHTIPSAHRPPCLHPNSPSKLMSNVTASMKTFLIIPTVRSHGSKPRLSAPLQLPSLKLFFISSPFNHLVFLNFNILKGKLCPHPFYVPSNPSGHLVQLQAS